MTADEFLEIADDACFYELVDGIVIMSPSPTPKHQDVAGLIYHLLASFLERHVVGKAFMETDLHLGKGPTGGDLVYRPDVVFIRQEHLGQLSDRLAGPPDLVVEVISERSRRFDTQTKKHDYERFGVREYWIIDPQRKAMTFYRLDSGRFVEVASTGDTFTSQAVPGFVLDLARVRQAFEPW